MPMTTCRTTARVFEAAGVHPERLHALCDLARLPFTTKADLRDELSVRPVRGAARASGAHSRLVGHHRQAHRRRLHAERHRHLGDAGGALDPRRGRTRGRHRPRRLRLRAVHRRTGRALRRGEARLHGDPDVGRQTERQVQLIVDFKPDIIMVTPCTCSPSPRSRSGRASIPGRRSLQIGIFGAEPWTPTACAQEIEAELRHRRHRHLRPVGGDGPGRGAGMHRDQGRADHLGRPFLPGDRRSATAARC